MPRKPYGKYDDLTPEERAQLADRLSIEAIACAAVGLGLMSLDRYELVPGMWGIPLMVLTMAAMLRCVVILAQRIAVLSPNPKRRGFDEPPPSNAPSEE